MAARNAKNTEATESADVAVEVPEKAERKPRTPKQVTDLPSASAAFNRAQRVAAKADKELEAAQVNSDAARTALGEAARAVKSYSAEITAAADAVLPVEAEDYPTLEALDEG